MNPIKKTSSPPARHPMHRRCFLVQAGRAAAALDVLPALPVLSQLGQPSNSFLAQIGKYSKMRVHNDRPGVLETPLELLGNHHITPKELLFVRNNQVFSEALTMRPLPMQGWTVEMIGLVNRVVRAEELTGYEQTEVEMVLQCSGNGRSYLADSVETLGTQWQKGGVGNVRWKGVLLKTVIEQLKLELDPALRFVTAEGKDAPARAGADFEHSLPLEDVLERGMLALEMNGEPIPAIHGGPVRLVIPGYYGTMNVKWLTRLRFEVQETNNYNHIPRYRTSNRPLQPGARVEYTFENSTPTWRQKIKSLIWKPWRENRLTEEN